MSIVELMITVGISSIVVLAASTVMIFVVDSFAKIVDKDEAETNLAQAAYALRIIATQAVDTVVTNGAANNLSAIVNDNNLTSGQIVNGLDTSGIAITNGTRGDIAEVGAFFREAALPNSATSVFRPTFIFFKLPWTTCPPNADAGTRTLDTCSGNLIIITGDPLQANTQVRIRDLFTGADPVFNRADFPTFQDLVFSRFTSIRVASAATNNYARDARITLTVRHFMGNSLGKNLFNYHPDVAVNAPQVLVKDLSMEVYIGFRNNFLGVSQLGNNEAERLHGSLYYFPFYSPLRGI